MSFAFWVSQINIQNPDFKSTDAAAWSKRVVQLAKMIKSGGTSTTKGSSVSLVQECNSVRAGQLAKQLGKTWTWDRVADNSVNPRAVNCVFYDSAKWTRVGLIYKILPGNGTRTLIAVKLRRKGVKDAPVITFGSTHFETLASGYAKSAAEAQRLRDRQAHAVVSALPKTRVIVGGDFNDTDYTSGPRDILHDAGYLPLRDRVAIKNYSMGTSDSGKTIDEVCSTKDLQVTFAERVNATWASDHNMTRLRVVA